MNYKMVQLFFFYLRRWKRANLRNWQWTERRRQNRASPNDFCVTVAAAAAAAVVVVVDEVDAAVAVAAVAVVVAVPLWR